MPKFQGACGDPKTVMLNGGCSYTYEIERKLGSFWDWFIYTYQCQAGVWVKTFEDGDGGSCGDCHGTTESWYDDCGGTSNTSLMCP
jgi:hypothetical protein